MQLNNQADLQTYRIPLVGTEYTRIIRQAENASSGIMQGTVGVMIVGFVNTVTTDQRVVNAIPERIVNEFTNKNTYYLSKRPGFQLGQGAAAQSPAPKGGTAIHVWAGQGNGTEIIAAYGTPNSKLYTMATPVSPALPITGDAIQGQVKYIIDVLVGADPYLVFSTDSNTAYTYKNGDSIKLISDSDFPANAGEFIVGPPVSLDGYIFFMTQSGKIFNSDLNTPTSYIGDFIEAQMDPDQGLGLIRYKDQIAAIGTSSIEFFQDAGNATGSPLQRTSQGFINIGCVNSEAFCTVGDTFAFIGSTDQSTVSLYMLSGLEPQKISTPPIDALLSTSNPTNLKLNAINLMGQTLILVVDTSAQRTYVYSVELEIWHEWLPAPGGSILWERTAGSATGTKYILAVTTQDNLSNLYYINPINYDFSEAQQVIVQTSKLDLGNQKLKFCSKFRLIGDIGIILSGGVTQNYTVNIEWSDDDYQTWHSARTVDMSKLDAHLDALGSFRRRAWRITYGPTGTLGSLRLEALEVDLAQGYV